MSKELEDALRAAVQAFAESYGRAMVQKHGNVAGAAELNLMLHSISLRWYGQTDLGLGFLADWPPEKKS